MWFHANIKEGVSEGQGAVLLKGGVQEGEVELSKSGRGELQEDPEHQSSGYSSDPILDQQTFILCLKIFADVELPASTLLPTVLNPPPPLQLRQIDYEISKLALTSYFPMHMRNGWGWGGLKKLFIPPCLFHLQWNHCCPLETKPVVQFWGERTGWGILGAALHYQNKPFSKQTIRHS